MDGLDVCRELNKGRTTCPSSCSQLVRGRSTGFWSRARGRRLPHQAIQRSRIGGSGQGHSPQGQSNEADRETVESKTLEFADLRIDREKRLVQVKEIPVNLTAKASLADCALRGTRVMSTRAVRSLIRSGVTARGPTNIRSTRISTVCEARSRKTRHNHVCPDGVGRGLSLLRPIRGNRLTAIPRRRVPLVIKTNTVYAKLAGALWSYSHHRWNHPRCDPSTALLPGSPAAQPPGPRGAHCRRRAAHRRRPDRRGGAQARFPHDDGDQSDHRALPARPRRGNPRLLRSSGKGQALTSRQNPVATFVGGSPRLPILGDDPRHPETRNIFSASKITREGVLEGYLYIVLASEHFVGVAGMLRGSYILRTGAWASGRKRGHHADRCPAALAISLAASPASIGTSGGSGRSLPWHGSF